VNCYENRIRDEITPHYDIERVIQNLKAVIKNHDCVTIHGGEPLMIDLNHLERLLEIVYQEKLQTGIQSNLLLVTDKHIELFKRYRTHVGISIDGITNDYNSSRGYDPIHVLHNIDRLKNSGVAMSAIIVLWKTNSAGIMELIEYLVDKGIRDFRINPGIGFCDPKVELDSDTLYRAWLRVAEGFSDPDLSINPFRDMIDLLMGHKNATCNFSGCDPYRTCSEVTLYEDGTFGNCLKPGSALDGFRSMRADTEIKPRQEALQQISFEHGGCGGCKYWTCCHGGCPGEAINFDWRNKSRFCEAWHKLFAYFEDKIKSLFPNALTASDFRSKDAGPKDTLTSLDGSTWRQNTRKNPLDLLKKIEAAPVKGNEHGDSPHGDAHGDHTDG